MTDVYIENLRSLPTQVVDPGDSSIVAWSSYYNSDDCVKQVKGELYFRQWYPTILRPIGRLAVNHTFNYTCKKLDSTIGPFDAFLYVASDVKFIDPLTITKFISPLRTGKYGIIFPQVTEDSGYRWTCPEIYPDFPDSNYEVPLGNTANLHCALFSRTILDAYGAILPDIFTSYCTEAIFSYLCAAIKQKFIILKDLIVQHGKPGHQPGTPDHQVDGHTIAFGQGHNKVYPGARPIEDIISDPLAKEVGLGYEEWHHRMEDGKPHLLHDRSKFTEGYANDYRLKEYIKYNFYLGNLLNYSSIEEQKEE